MKRFLVGATLVALLVLGGCSNDEPPADSSDDSTGLANPASVYCEEQGGRVDIRKDDGGGQYGVCVFSDGTEVEEWAYFRGEAEPTAP